MPDAKARLRKPVKDKWVAALRSGKYQQGQGALRARDNKFCCLGVLCELAVKAGVIPAPMHSEYTNAYDYGEEENPSTLPEEVIAWAYLKSSPEKSPNPLAGAHSLAEWNDGYVTADGHVGPVDFDGIADLIEKHL